MLEPIRVKKHVFVALFALLMEWWGGSKGGDERVLEFDDLAGFVQAVRVCMCLNGHAAKTGDISTLPFFNVKTENGRGSIVIRLLDVRTDWVVDFIKIANAGWLASSQLAAMEKALSTLDPEHWPE